MKHIKLFEGFLNEDTAPRGYSQARWDDKLKEIEPELKQIKALVEYFKKHMEKLYPTFEWTIEEDNRGYNYTEFGYVLNFKKPKNFALRFMSIRSAYKTEKIMDKNVPSSSRPQNPYEINIYFYPDIEIYGDTSKDQNPTISMKTDKLMTTKDIEKLLVDVDKKFNVKD
jgi:hypothetical protein